MRIAKQQVIAALAASVLAACGGGGGGGGGGDGGFSPSPPSGASVNAAMAWRNFLTTSQTWTVTGVASDGKTYTLGLTLTPGTAQIFPVNGISYATTRTDLSLKIGSLAVLTSVGESYFDSSYVLAGTRNTFSGDPSTCSVATTSVVPPTSAAIPSGGTLQAFNDLNGCLTSSPSMGTTLTTWGVETENGITFFCQNNASRDLNGALLAGGSTCVQTANDGTLGAKARITLTQPGFTLTARN